MPWISVLWQRLDVKRQRRADLLAVHMFDADVCLAGNSRTSPVVSPALVGSWEAQARQVCVAWRRRIMVAQQMEGGHLTLRQQASRQAGRQAGGSSDVSGGPTPHCNIWSRLDCSSRKMIGAAATSMLQVYSSPTHRRTAHSPHLQLLIKNCSHALQLAARQRPPALVACSSGHSTHGGNCEALV